MCNMATIDFYAKLTVQFTFVILIPLEKEKQNLFHSSSALFDQKMVIIKFVKGRCLQLATIARKLALV